MVRECIISCRYTGPHSCPLFPFIVKSLLQGEYTECMEEEALTIDFKDIVTFVNENDIRLPDNELVKVINEVFGSSLFKKGNTSKYPWHVCLNTKEITYVNDDERCF